MENQFQIKATTDGNLNSVIKILSLLNKKRLEVSSMDYYPLPETGDYQCSFLIKCPSSEIKTTTALILKQVGILCTEFTPASITDI